MKKLLQILNGIAFVSVVFINYLSNTGLMNNTTIGKISAEYRSLFTPAGYAFSIWGVIYILLLGFAIYQGKSLFKAVKNNDFIEKIGFWFVISCVANSAWVFCWIYEFTGLSCICIFILLVSLLKIVLNNSMQLYKTSFTIKLFVWWPFVIYSGWVTVASIANVATYLIKINWTGFGVSPFTWTVILISVATIINLIVTWKRNMPAFAFVGAWALIAIGVANQEHNLVVIANAAAGILMVSSLLNIFKNTKKSIF